MKNGGKNKSVAFIILVSVYIYFCLGTFKIADVCYILCYFVILFCMYNRDS